jgi:glutamate formiminotransferase/formiminotetrahydrofolate cyclodeaminase
MDECVELARQLGARVGAELGIPVYLYERAASRPERTSLAAIRTGEYEGLPAKLADPEWAPDFGPSVFHPRVGATVIGAREFLIAYNVNLNTRDRTLANEIALNIREGGRLKRDRAGKPVVDDRGKQVRVPGRLPAVRAIGWYIEQYRQAQVSINLINYRITPLHVVFETVREEAEKLGLTVTGSELVGLMPLQSLIDAGKFYLRRQGKSAGAPEREVVETAVRSLGLDQLAAFDPEKKIIEYHFRKRGALVSMSVDRFVDEVSSESPAPGGGSVAAHAGSLAAGLSAMVANLTVGKRGYEAAWDDLSAVAERAQAVKDRLVRAVDEDTDAFKQVMAAMRMPKGTPEEKAARRAALEAGYLQATRVPLGTARACREAMALALVVAERGNTNSAPDAGVAALMARAGVEGAVLNVLSNLGSVKDEAFKQACREETGQLANEAAAACDQIMAKVRSTFA